MNPLKYLYRMVVLSLMISITGMPEIGYSQSIQINAAPSETSLEAGDLVEITVSIDDPADAHFISAEVGFDPEVFEFNEISVTDLTENGIETADLISPGVLGAAVSRTSDLSTPSAGDLMILAFNVKTFSPAGENSMEFENVQFGDSNGDPIDFDPPEDVDLIIGETISSFSLNTPQSITLTEGDSYQVVGEVFANGVTTNEANTSKVNVWVGVNETDSDPSTWNESAWELMSFEDQTTEDFFEYLGEIALQRNVGTYYVALRADLDDSEDYTFAGVNGFWNATENPTAELVIQQQEQYQYIVAEWSFSNEVYTPDRAIFPNQMNELEIVGASMNGFVGGAANSNSWDEFSVGESYWQIMINTEDLEELKLSSDHSGGSSTGPKDFKVQYSVDGTSWTDLSGGVIEVGNSSMEVIEELSLPQDVENEPEVYIRWVQTSDARVDADTEKEISGGGTSRIDDIQITGQAISTTRVDVWPGDADSDGTVDEDDVLELATYWLSEGPPAIYPTIEWAPREVEEWIPGAATYADANGDGRVDHNDLQPIGLHFGESVPGGQSMGRQVAILSHLDLEPMQAGESVNLYLVADALAELSGISFRIDLNGLDRRFWSVDEIEPLQWAEEWYEENRMIEFTTYHEDLFAAGLVHKGLVQPVTAQNLVRVQVRAEQDWDESVTARLLRASVSANQETKTFSSASLTKELAVSVEPPVAERPERTQLLPNYPNPFNPATTIPYMLSEPGDVQIEVFDAIGRRVALFHRRAQQAGEHTLQFDASELSSGLYLYRFRSKGVIQTRKMMLLK